MKFPPFVVSTYPRHRKPQLVYNKVHLYPVPKQLIYHPVCLSMTTDHQISPGGGGGGGTPYVMGDTYVPRFWPPFFTLAGSSTIFLGYFFSSTNTKTIFCGIKTTNSYRIWSFRPQISFFPRSFWVQFSAASGTSPSFFGPSTPPPPGKYPCIFYITPISQSRSSASPHIHLGDVSLSIMEPMTQILKQPILLKIQKLLDHKTPWEC